MDWTMKIILTKKGESHFQLVVRIALTLYYTRDLRTEAKIWAVCRWWVLDSILKETYMNRSGQHSSSKRFWSLALSWLKLGIDLVQRTTKNSNFAADSNTISWLDAAELAADDVDRPVCTVRISSELLTSSSFPFKSLADFGIVSKGSGFGTLRLHSSVSFFVGIGDR